LGEGIDNVFLGGFEGSAIYAVVGEEFGSIFGGQWLKDESGNIIIEDDPNSASYGYPIQDAQVGVVGNINPDWIAGIFTSLSWKGLTLSGLLDIREGGDIWNGTLGALNFFGMSEVTENRGDSTTFTGVFGHYDPDGNVVTSGTANNVTVPLDQTWYQGLGSGFSGPAEQFVEDGSYIRLRELALSYDFGENIVNKTPFASLELGLVARNLILITDYSGVDPETSLTGANNSQGMDYFNMPGTKSYGINLRVTL
jgi:hypothetical protein